MTKFSTRWNGAGWTGLLLMAAPLPTWAQGQPASPATSVRYDVRNGYTLAFVDADIKRVVDAVLGSMLNVDYSVDPNVQGNITLRTAKPVSSDSLVPLLESALRSVDAVLLVQGGSYRVIPKKDAQNRALLGASGAPLQGFGAEVITLHHASAPEIARLIEQFLGKEALVGADKGRNQVVIRGTADEREAARAMIARFDVDSLAGMNFEIYRLENVDAESLVKEMERIFEPPFDIVGSRVRLIPLPRLRSVLAIAADRGDIGRVEPWVRRLDAGLGGKPKLYNYAVQNGRARDIAASLQRVLGMGGGLPDQTDSQPLTQSTGFETTAIQADANGGSMSVDRATVAVASSNSLAIDTGSGKGPRIVPNEQNNSLLIYANGEQYEFIRDALQKLDQPVAQVFIEATLAEVTLQNDFDLGVDWSFLSGRSSFDLRNAATAAPAAIFPGFSYGYTSSSAQVVLNTLQSRTNVKVLSTPKLLVLNNQTATLQVGDQVPIVTQQAQSTASEGAPIINSVEMRDTGVILKVTPRVNDSGTITLDIAQEVSDVVETTTSGINSPTIQQRKLTSTVATKSGAMIALGGLIRDRTSNQKSGIPILSQIPVVGAAFGSQDRRAKRTELIILLTPTVIRGPEEAKAMVDDLVQRLDAAAPLVGVARQKMLGGPLPPAATPAARH